MNAFLLFLLQPLFASMVLPHLGGTAAVWTTCLLFFQVALLAGYLYAHAIALRLPARGQLLLHAGLLASVAVTLPVSIPMGWTAPDPAEPIAALLGLLTARIGPAFILLAAGSPLLQHWFARSGASDVDPYRLYVASNIGSATALLAYPIFLQPYLRVETQALLWTVGFIALTGAITACGTLALRFSPGVTRSASRREHLPWHKRARWIALAAAPSSLLLGVTTHLTTDIAPVPLLWVVPLVLYLLTFVVAFGEFRRFPTQGMLAMQPYLVIGVAGVLFLQSEVPGVAGYALHLIAFFVCALACHTDLAASRPGPSGFTEFYIWLSVGGAVGGLFNVEVAPRVFASTLEYPIAIVACIAVLAPGARGHGWLDLALPLVLAITLIVGGLPLPHPGREDRLAVAALFLFGAVVSFAFRRRAVRFALGLSAILGTGVLLQTRQEHTRLRARSFYNVYRVVDDSTRGLRVLYSGTTIHGAEFLSDSGTTPLAYYHRDGPLGSLFANRRWRTNLWRVGVVGLGVGSILAYARPGEYWTFYEIDPLVARIAGDGELFRFLKDAKVQPRIVLGDARISMERERQRAFDILIVDAFSSDAIPIHLLTREALALYRSRTAPDGIIAWHISNKYLDLSPVLAALAKDAHLSSFVCADLTVSDAKGGRFPSIWVLMTADARTAAAIAQDTRWLVHGGHATTRLWTDDYSNVLAVLR